MPVPQDPRLVADRWVQRLSGATQKMTDSVRALTVSPTQQAAAAVQVWQQRVADPLTAQKFQRSLQRVSLADWQQAFINKGIGRIATGAQNAHDKFQAFLTAFLPFVDNVANQVRTMPKVTLEDRINRMIAQVRGTAQFKRP